MRLRRCHVMKQVTHRNTLPQASGFHLVLRVSLWCCWQACAVRQFNNGAFITLPPETENQPFPLTACSSGFCSFVQSVKYRRQVTMRFITVLTTPPLPPTFPLYSAQQRVALLDPRAICDSRGGCGVYTMFLIATRLIRPTRGNPIRSIIKNMTFLNFSNSVRQSKGPPAFSGCFYHAVVCLEGSMLFTACRSLG